MRSDIALLQAIAGGERAAMDDLYQRYGLQLLNFLIGQVENRQLAEDILQNVMLAVWNQAAGFRAESSVRTWLFAIARRQAWNARQRGRDHAHLPEDHPAELSIEQALEVEALAEAIRNLPIDQQQALELYFYRGFSLAECAEKVGVPVNTFKSRLHRAKQSLREQLKESPHG